jgi:hypothetical protein
MAFVDCLHVAFAQFYQHVSIQTLTVDFLRLDSSVDFISDKFDLVDKLGSEHGIVDLI